MSNSSAQKQRPDGAREMGGGAAAAARGMEELPMESSPYVRYDDVEDYKRQGYGTGGHQQPVERPFGGGGTDAPTPSGSGLLEGQQKSGAGGKGAAQ
ncbi:hypothetical protein Taro_002157 [Colocasia esculenta]|uniref:Uncharacterized protein n=1 Tax=Colocasia esculenta TaxID=4460 RepID=A0A843TFR9_COLES|nr:hypothetical protein [Colocasia esculenta]